MSLSLNIQDATQNSDLFSWYPELASSPRLSPFLPSALGGYMFANYSTESPSSSESSHAQEHWGFWGVIHLKMPWQGFTAIQESSSFASWHSRLLPRGGLRSDLQLLKMQEAFRVDLLSFPLFRSQSIQLDSSIWRVPPALRPAEDTQLMRGQPCPQGASIPAKEMKTNEGKCLNKWDTECSRTFKDRGAIFKRIGEGFVGKKKKTLEIDLEKRAFALPQTHVNLLMKIQEYLDSSHTPL